jgi:prolyl-tRNA synthetase
MTRPNNSRHAMSTTRAQDFPKWYQEVVREGDLAEMAHVRGCMVMKPWGYGIWERMRTLLDREIQARGCDNAYFPLFIPLSYMQKEADHVKGFAKEMAVVTHHRLEERDGRLVPAAPLDEPIIVRPTSETIIGASMAQWIQSYRDLPLRLNQWANVVRWELRPRVLLRTTEFLWQEGHTAHANRDEAMAVVHDIHRMYRQFSEGAAAIPIVPGEKSASERFPGAENTFTIEAMMQDGKALQAGTSHYLGQNFSRASDIRFLNQEGERELAYMTSWGITTRMVGAIAMTHGDDDGMCVPPRIAPSQVVVVPILRGNEHDERVTAYATKIADRLRSVTTKDGEPVRARFDDRHYRAVEKRWQWVKRGAPIVVEVGPRDEAAANVTFRSRLNPYEQRECGLDQFLSSVSDELDAIQEGLYARAHEMLLAGIRRDITTFDEAKEFFATGRGFVLTKWCGGACEEALKPLGASIRCIPSELESTAQNCLLCGGSGTMDVIIAMSY